MNAELRALFIVENYEYAIVRCKNLLQIDSNNYELWYDLFLAENDNYIHIDYNNIRDEMAFNKACDLAPQNIKDAYISEYNFYKNIISV